MPVVGDERLQALLDTLHAESDEQKSEIVAFEARRGDASNPPGAEEIRAFRHNKLVALDRDKAEFCYQLCRAKKACRIIDVGTSCGVSTLYLAAAVRDNVAELARISHTIFARWRRMAREHARFFGDVSDRCIRGTRADRGFCRAAGRSEEGSRWALR